MEMKAEAWLVHLQAPKCQRLPAATRRQERGTEWRLPQPPEGAHPADTLMSDFPPPELWSGKPVPLSFMAVVNCFTSPGKLIQGSWAQGLQGAPREPKYPGESPSSTA